MFNLINKNLISILDLSKEQQSSIFDLADNKNLLFSKYNHALEDKVLGTFFSNLAHEHNLVFNQHLYVLVDII